MICNNTFHDKNCPSYNNALKGASAQQQPNKQLMFNSSEVQILSKTLEICKLYVNNNSFQSKDILNELNQSLKILKPGMNQLKGASSISNICPKQTLRNIKNLFGLN